MFLQNNQSRSDSIEQYCRTERDGLCMGLWDARRCFTPHSIQVASVVVRINDMHASAHN